MFRLLLRIITRCRLFFMMGEPLENVFRKMHGFDSVLIEDYSNTDSEMIDLVLRLHVECIFFIENRNLHLQYAKSSLIKCDSIKNKGEDRLIVYRWYESRG